MKKTACFLSGLMLVGCMLLCAVIIPALSTFRFEQALLTTVDQQALSVSEKDLSAFAEETMRYLKGQKPKWQPQIPRQGVPDHFIMHMEEVRGWVSAAPWVLGAGLLAAAGLLMAGGRQRKPVMLGVFTVIGLIVCVLLWAAVDFHSLWMVLHKAFIPNGIFAWNEPVMQLFPLALFMQYLLPVALWAAGLTTALCVILLRLTRSLHSK